MTIPLVLLMCLMVTTYPFGMLAAGYRLPPFYEKPGWIEETFDIFDEKGTILRGWVYTGIILFILIAYIGGFIWAWKNYSFARTFHTVV